jgi:HK97 family phage portal protein
MIFDRIVARRAERSAGAPSYGLIPPLGSVQSASGQLISQATAMGVSTVYACVRRRAQDVARCAPSLYTVDAAGTRTNVDDHPLALLFDRPNRVQTWFEFAEQMGVALLLRMNAYAVVLRDERGIPRELIPINPDAVMVLEAENGDVFYSTNRIGLFQMAVLRDLPVTIPAEDMFHIRGLTFNSLVGVSTIGLARDAIGLAAGQEQQASRWMANGARPSGVLESDKPLSEDAGKRLYDRWQQFKAGIQNVGTTAVLEDGVKWKSMSLSSVDLEFLNSRSFQIPEICRFFGVPPHKVFVVDRAASMSIPQQDQDYVNSTITPDLDRWEQKLEAYFNLEADEINVHFDEGQLLRADVITRFNALRTGILTGIITPNEARETEGLPPLPGGDHLLVPANTAALGSDMTGSGADEAGRPIAGDPKPPKVGTGGTQKTDDDNPELVGAEELEPRALIRIPVERGLLLSGVPVRHQAKIRARLKGKRIVPAMVIRALPDSAVRSPEPAAAPVAALPDSAAQPIALTVNVDASKPLVRRVISKAADGSLEVVEVPLDPKAEAGVGAGVRYSPDQPRDDKGRFADEGPSDEASSSGGGDLGAGGGGGAAAASETTVDKDALAAALTQSTTPATDMFREQYDPSVTPNALIAAQPQSTQELLAKAEARFPTGVRTNALVSEGGHKNPDGTYTTERAALHDQIIAAKLNEAAIAAARPAAGEKPTYTIYGGRGGSGKSWLSGENGPMAGTSALNLNTDDIKEALPEYQGWNAGLVHEESSDIFNRMTDIARGMGLNVIHDSTMKTAENAQKYVDDFKAAGYVTNGYYMGLPPQEAGQRAIDRFVNGTARLTDAQRASGMMGRYVAPDYVLKSVTNEKSFDALKGQFKNWAVYDNNVPKGTAPKLVAKS